MTHTSVFLHIGYRVGLSLPKNAHVYWHNDTQPIAKPSALGKGKTPYFDKGKSK